MSKNPRIVFLQEFANPDAFNTSALIEDGELGAEHWYGDKKYQRVRLDSGATADTSVGVVAANQLAYWKDPANFLVTNDSAQALGGQTANGYRNFVAGIFRASVTAGNYCDLLQKGRSIPVADGGNTFAAGEQVIAEGATAAAADRIAAGTASTYKPIGIARGAASGGNVNVDVDIPPAPEGG